MVAHVAFTTEWRGEPDALLGRFFALVGASLALHAPLSPLVVLLGLVGLLAPPPAPPPADLNELNAIPIDLLEDGSREVPAPGDEVVAPAPEPAVAAAPAVQEVVGDPVDAGAPAPDASPEAVVDAGNDATVVPDAAADADADGADAAAPTRVRDPVAIAAKESKVVDSNAVIQITVYSENFRQHPLGPRMGRLLAHLPQWQDFFGPAGLDPVANIDRIMMVGPDLADSSGLAVLIQHRLDPTRIRGAVDTLVQRSRGRWLEGSVPAAIASADRAERVFVMPSRSMVVVAPLSARDSALAFPATARVPPPEGDEALYGALKAPGYAFEKHGVPVRLPESIESVEFWVTPLPDGGAVGRFVARDRSAADAQRSLESLRSQAETLRAATGLMGLGSTLLGRRSSGIDPEDLAVIVVLIGGLELTVHGAEVHGTVTVPRPVCEAVIARVERQFRMPVAASSARPRGVPPIPSASGSAAATRPAPAGRPTPATTAVPDAR